MKRCFFFKKKQKTTTKNQHKNEQELAEMHWFGIFLTTACSYFGRRSTEGKEHNRKIAQAFPSYTEGGLKISTDAVKHLLLYKRQCSDTPVIGCSSS